MIRSDIQCLRGIAILFVLLFHLIPDVFVNGFLGVDIFFVISGFLMAKNLTSSKLDCIHDFLEFYYRRFRRILPMYYLSVFLIVVGIHLYLEDFIHENNDRYSSASLFLVTNQLVIHDQTNYFSEYFASSSSMNGFLHLWSLSVEMQFYLFVPIIFFGLKFLKDNDYLKLLTASLITVIGFIPFALINKQFAFNFMFLRLWQFSAGFMTLFLIKIKEKKQKMEEEHKNQLWTYCPTKDDLTICALSVLALCLLPKNINVLVLRPIVTLTTALIIATESENVQILKSTSLEYIGDISYVLYLVHWPIIACMLASTFRNYLICLVTIFILSILLHHVFEKQYLKLDMKGMLGLILLLILANAYLQYSVRNDGFWRKEITGEAKEIVDKNRLSFTNLWDQNPPKDKCIESIEVAEANGNFNKYCRFPPGSGNISIMMVGNSYVLNLGENFRAHFKYNYSDYRFLSIVANYGLYADDTAGAGVSKQGLFYSRQQVEQHKPDVLIIVSKYFGRITQPIEENDGVVREINENIEFYEKFVKKLYILDAFPTYPMNFLNRFLHFVVRMPDDVERLHLDRKLADVEMKTIKKRFSQMKCKKCQFFDLSKVFMEGDKYLTFDRNSMMSYVDNTVHLTSAGVKLCDPVFEKLAEEIMSSF